MQGVLVDSNVILDVFEDDPKWAVWSEMKLQELGERTLLYINPIIYAEVSIGFQRVEELEAAINGCDFRMIHIPKEGLFLAGKAFLRYRQRKGSKAAPLPDFFIGAHAAVSQMKLLTRDTNRYRTYFPTVEIICPEGY